MTQAEKGKNIFQTALDAVSNRDEKAAVEAAMKHAQELEQQVAQLQQSGAQSAQLLAATNQKLADSEKKVVQMNSDMSKIQAELVSTQTDLANARNATFSLQQQLNATNDELQKYVSAEQAKQITAAAEAAAKAQVIAEHTLKADETLSHLSLKYYGSAYEPYWRVIYEANKELIGPNPGHVHPGMVIKIPVLPEELKKN